MTTSTKPTWHTLRIGIFSFKLYRRLPYILGIMLLLGFGVLLLSISYGEYNMSLSDVLRTLLGIQTNGNYELVVWSFRLPRILVAFMVGVALALSGTIIQGITQNPLTDPGILGITAGAALSAVSIIVWFDAPLEWLPAATFGGASLMAALTYFLAWRNGSSPIRLILIGIGLSSIATALINLMLALGDITQVQSAMLWLAGSTYGSNWRHVRLIAVVLLPLMMLSFILARQLNTLALGDALAQGLGINIERQRGLLLLCSVALAAISVAVAGSIGFIGLVAPHIARRLVGSTHESLLPTAALLGGILLMFSDLVGRWIIAPAELPTGLMAAILGAPYFAYLLYQTRNL